MQITSLSKKARKQLFHAVCFAMLTCDAASVHACAWNIKVGKHPAIELNGKKLKMNHSLAAKLLNAEAAAILPVELAHVLDASTKWLLLRNASRVRGTAGYCGSGHEDRLILLQVKGPIVRAGGEYLAQSCLSSISMDVDQLPELVHALNQDSETGDLSFSQIFSNESTSFRRSVTITVREGNMKVLTRTSGVSAEAGQ